MHKTWQVTWDNNITLRNDKQINHKYNIQLTKQKKALAGN